MMATQEFIEGNASKKREMIGNIIYEHVERIAGSMKAPKLTGMIIDLPNAELFEAISTYENLDLKVSVAKSLLDNDPKPAPSHTNGAKA